MRADRAVEPTKSENITVTWRRSARSSGEALGALDVVASVSGRRLYRPHRYAEQQWHRGVSRRCPSAVTPSSFRSSCRQAREDPFVDLIVAECRLVLLEAQAPQPDRNIHEDAHNQGWRTSSSGP